MRRIVKEREMGQDAALIGNLLKMNEAKKLKNQNDDKDAEIYQLK